MTSPRTLEAEVGESLGLRLARALWGDPVSSGKQTTGSKWGMWCPKCQHREGRRTWALRLRLNKIHWVVVVVTTWQCAKKLLGERQLQKEVVFET